VNISKSSLCVSAKKAAPVLHEKVGDRGDREDEGSRQLEAEMKHS
jgi:hypothetical protein